MSRAAIRRQLVRLLLITLVLVGTSVALARPAAADVCADAPAPVPPKSGLPGMLTTVPKDVPDAAPDPFAEPSDRGSSDRGSPDRGSSDRGGRVPIGDVYGHNWGWTNYDLGCGSDFLRDPVAITNTKSANVVMAGVGGVLAGLDSLERMAKTSSVDWLTTVVKGIAETLSGPLLAVWLPLAVVAVGLILGYRARRAPYADTLRTALIVAGAVGMATFALVFPATASSAVDKGVVAVADVAGQQFSASATDAVTRESAYRTWLTGNFGDPDSPLAQELGPRLLSATRYSWSDMKRIGADPAAKKAIDTQKAAEFKAVAKIIEDRDPGAYEMFTGRGERSAPALLGGVVVLCMGLFVALALFMVLMGRVMMQGLALAAPLAAVLGVLPTHTAVLSRLWDLFTASIVAVAKFVIAGGVMALVLSAIQANPNLGAGAKLFWVLVVTVVGLVISRPIRSFKTIVPGLDPDKSYLKMLAGGAANYLGARVGAEQGTEQGAEQGLQQGLAPSASSEQALALRVASSDARESLEPLPRPVWSRPPDPVWTQVPDQQDSSRVGDAPAALPNAARMPAAISTGAADWTRGRAWPGVLAAPLPRSELPSSDLGRTDLARTALAAEPLRLQAVDYRPDGNRPHGDRADGDRADGDWAGGDRAGGGLLSVSAEPISDRAASIGTTSDVVVDAPTVPAGLEGTSVPSVTPIRPEVLHRDRPGVAAASGTEVVYPTGIIVAAEEHPLYHRPGDLGTGVRDVYLTLPEPELADDGTEHDMLSYRRPVGVGNG